MSGVSTTFVRVCAVISKIIFFFSFNYKYFKLVRIRVARVERPVTQLLCMVNDMAEKTLLTDGLDKLVNISIDHNNLAQSYTLFDFLLTEGGKIKKNSFSKMLKLAVNTESEEDILRCARIFQRLGLLTNKALKKQIFPNLHNCPELVVTRLEDAGMERQFTVIPMIKWLIGQGKIEGANSLAGIFLELLDLDEIYHCLLSRHCQCSLLL